MEHPTEGMNAEGLALEDAPPPYKRRYLYQQYDADAPRRRLQPQHQQVDATYDEPPEEEAVTEPCEIKARPLHSILDSISRRKGRPASYLKSRLSRNGSSEADAWCGTFGGVTEVGAVAVDPSLAANGVAVDLPCSTGAGFTTDEADTYYGLPASHAVNASPLPPSAANGWRHSSPNEHPSRDDVKLASRDTSAPAVSSSAFPLVAVAAAAVTPREPSHGLQAGAAIQAAAAAAAAVPAAATAAAIRRRTTSVDPGVLIADAPAVVKTSDRSQSEQEEFPGLHQLPVSEQQDGCSATDQPPNGQLSSGGDGGEPMLFTCEHCGIQLPRARDLNRHMLSHTRMHVCSHCGHRSSSAYNLRVHIRTHTGERPHACSECGQTFTQTCSLKRHALMHAAERVQTCRVCHKQFLPGLPLSKHMLKHIGEKTFICEACDSLEAPPPPTPQARARAARASAAARRQGAAAAAAAASPAAVSPDGLAVASAAVAQVPSPSADRAAYANGSGASAAAVL